MVNEWWGVVTGELLFSHVMFQYLVDIYIYVIYSPEIRSELGILY